MSSTIASSASSSSSSSAAPTIGMRIDEFLMQMDDLSSTQLYALIVAATVAICFVLLGSGGSVEDVDCVASTTTTTTTTKTGTNKSSVTSASTTSNPQPRWHLFRWINYVFIAAFLGSVIQFGIHASSYLEMQNKRKMTDMVPLQYYLVGWCIFLCYFFGFFGISLVHHDITSDQEEQEQQQQQQQQQQALVHPDVTKSSSVGKTSSLSSKPKSSTIPNSSKTTNSSLHPPASCTPVCSDPLPSVSKKTSSSIPTNLKEWSDSDIANLVLSNKLKDHELEKRLDPFRAVTVRRIVVNAKLASIQKHNNNTNILDKLPAGPSLDYSRVYGANCEIVVGYVPLPVGLVGPLTLNNETVYVPMATTEGCLVASTNRGAKAITQGSGATACIIRDGITRAPCVRMESAYQAAQLKVWCEDPRNFQKLKAAFESTTSFGKLQACSPTVAGKNVYLRLVCFSGDAMGMNMVSKGSLAVMELLQEQFPSLQLVALSGNMCTDKKAAATNWLEGRGKSVVVEATIPKDVVRSTLKTTVSALVYTNLHKNLIGSAMAGTIGGFNAHASNIVTAIFLATGQDPAQNVESSNCITLLEEDTNGDLWISCTMPSIEVGCVGGGTSLEAQGACLDAIGCRGGAKDNPGDHAKKLATVVAAATMAGELSLLAALAANTLVQAHMTHNRKK